MSSRTVRTTLALPADLLAAVDEAVREGQARSRAELVRTALRREIAAQRRAAIDADLAGMAHDAEYRAEAEAIMQEFAQADWEAFQLGERAYTSDDHATG